MTQQEARARVARGAALLDKNRPGWTRAIDTGELEMWSMVHCIVGQLCGDYTPVRVGVPKYESGADYGFDVRNNFKDGNNGYQRLQDAWIDAIADRLHPVTEIPAPVEAERVS